MKNIKILVCLERNIYISHVVTSIYKNGFDEQPAPSCYIFLTICKVLENCNSVSGNRRLICTDLFYFSERIKHDITANSSNSYTDSRTDRKTSWTGNLFSLFTVQQGKIELHAKRINV